MPRAPGGILRGSTLVFTGDELIRWSGNEGEELPAVPDGWALVIGR
ncbi:MAG: hypothetical protein U0667_18235 [Chloroflexota bacterium]